MTLIDAATGEVVPAMTASEAREVTNRITATVEECWGLIIQAYKGRAWVALGYESWDAYTTTEFGTDRIKLPASKRLEVVAEMRDAGMSTRAIASATGASVGTIHADSQVFNSEHLGEEILDVEIVGLDGKTYQPSPRPITKPDLGGGISHPARYSDSLLPIFADVLAGYDRVVDPFAGTGRIHELSNQTVGVEIEPEWAELHPDTIVGDALALPFKDGEFDAICTSPTYGNRLADHHNASDPETRRSYTHDLGRALAATNSGAMQWGDEYRTFHLKAWREAVRVLRPGGRFVLNIKDHIREGARQPVSAWHAGVLMDYGLKFVDCIPVVTSSLRQGANATARVDAELVWVFDK